MRELKFRGKRIDNGEWVYGYYGVSIKGTHYIDTVTSMSMDHSIVDQKTFGEYTGINDINGVEIYEGDVVRFTQEWEIGADRDKIEVVQFQHGGFTPMCRTLGGVYYECQSERYEVIGNVHDNPELKKYI